MNKLLYAAALSAAITLVSCSGHSEADKQQLQDAHREAHELLDAMKQTPTRPTTQAEQSVSPAPADSVSNVN